MITSAKNYTKKDRQNPRRNGKTKLYRQNHTQKHTRTHSQKEKKEKYIYISIYFLKRERVTKSINKSTNDNKL